MTSWEDLTLVKEMMTNKLQKEKYFPYQLAILMKEIDLIKTLK
jgi:hypothetical protein